MSEASHETSALVEDLRRRIHALDADALDLIFREARTYRAWQPREVSDVVLQQLFELMRFGPTSGNCCPARLVFVKSPEAKARLEPSLDAGNVDKTMAAPVCAIFAHDMAFYDDMGWLAPGMKFGDVLRKKPALAEETAFRNGSLQGGYFIVAARALGLDCGAMSGFDSAAVDREFFAGTEIRSNFLCNLGYGDPSGLRPRAPRHDFDQACTIL